MKKFLSALVAVSCAVLVFGAVGCGPKAPYRVVPVEGSVEWRGEPLVGATLTFTPIETDGRPSKATTREGGKFVAKHAVDPRRARRENPLDGFVLRRRVEARRRANGSGKVSGTRREIRPGNRRLRIRTQESAT